MAFGFSETHITKQIDGVCLYMLVVLHGTYKRDNFEVIKLSMV